MKFTILFLLLAGCASGPYETKSDAYWRTRNFCASQAYSKLAPPYHWQQDYSQCMADFLYLGEK